MSIPLRVLIVEDSEDDALLVIDEFRDGGYDPSFERVETREQMVAALVRQDWDIIIADYRLPSFNGLEALEIACENPDDCPFIIISGQISEETAVDAMRAGAKDYILKGNLKRLIPAVERELREAEVRRQRQKAEKALQAERDRSHSILESITDGFYALDKDWRFTYVNGEAEIMMQRDWRSLKGQNIWEMFLDLVDSPLYDSLYKAMIERTPTAVEVFSPSISAWVAVRAYPYSDGLAVYVRDITAQKNAEEALEDALKRERHFSLLLQRALLPEEPSINHGYSVAVEYIPYYMGREIGGDFYDVFEAANGKAGVIIGDVSGKGLEAASLASATRTTIHTLIHETGSAGEALARANVILCKKQSSFESQFVTVFAVVINLDIGSFNYASAGHPPAAIRRSNGDVQFLKPSFRPPVCLIPERIYPESRDHLDPGDVLVLYTDGIAEARKGADLFDFKGIEQSLRKYGHLPVDDIARELVTAASNWAEGHLSDDAAVVVIKRE